MRLVLFLTFLLFISSCAAHEVKKEEVTYGSHVTLIFLCGEPLYASGANLHERVRGTLMQLSPDEVYAVFKRITESAAAVGTVDSVDISTLIGFECPEEREA